MKILAKVAYKGTNYLGWQRQSDSNTIQETIENVLSQILNTPTIIYGSGRTDAGVHAKGQTFHFEVYKDIDLETFRYSCNCLLPKDIHINSLEKVDDDFHARYSVKGKHYSYTIQLGENNPFTNEFSYNFVRPFDINKFKLAVVQFEGQFNFQDFTSKEEDERNFVRNVKVNVVSGGNIVRVDFIGDGFMRYMIRFMIGASIAVAEGKEKLSFITEHLNNEQERKIINYKAPAEGLILEEVFY